MTLPPPPTGDEELTEALARFMGWRKENGWTYEGQKIVNWYDGDKWMAQNWNPLTDWNHWRQVEEKIMEDETVWLSFYHHVCNGVAADYMRSGLRRRCTSALFAVRVISEAFSSPSR